MNDFTECVGCSRRDFLYSLLAAGATIGYSAQAELKDFFAALPKSVSPDVIPNKDGAVKVRLVFSIWDDVQVKKAWPNVGFDFRPVMKNITDSLNGPNGASVPYEIETHAEDCQGASVRAIAPLNYPVTTVQFH